MSITDRPYAFVLYGATGFTGQLVARNTRANARPPWAVAGRNQSKLQEVVRALPADLREPELIIADAGDAGSLAKCAKAPKSSSRLSAPMPSTARNSSRRASERKPLTVTSPVSPPSYPRVSNNTTKQRRREASGSFIAVASIVSQQISDVLYP